MDPLPNAHASGGGMWSGEDVVGVRLTSECALGPRLFEAPGDEYRLLGGRCCLRRFGGQVRSGRASSGERVVLM